MECISDNSKSLIKPADTLIKIMKEGCLAENLNYFLDKMLNIIIKDMNFESGGVYLIDEFTQVSEIVFSLNISDDFLGIFGKVDINTMPFNTVYKDGKMLIVENTKEQMPELYNLSGCLSVASFPIFTKSKVIGAINIASKQKYSITEEEKEIFSLIGNEVGEVITRLRIEQEKWASEELYRSIFELSPEAIVLLDSNINIYAINDRIADWLDYSPGEVLGKNLFSLDFLDDKNKELIKEKYMQRMKGQEVPQYELEFITKSGEKKIGLIQASLIKDDKGKLIHYIAMITDITERKNAEIALKKSNKRFRRKNQGIKMLI